MSSPRRLRLRSKNKCTTTSRTNVGDCRTNPPESILPEMDSDLQQLLDRADRAIDESRKLLRVADRQRAISQEKIMEIKKALPGDERTRYEAQMHEMRSSLTAKATLS